jgi:hypothetical protein
MPNGFFYEDHPDGPSSSTFRSIRPNAGRHLTQQRTSLSNGMRRLTQLPARRLRCNRCARPDGHRCFDRPIGPPPASAREGLPQAVRQKNRRVGKRPPDGDGHARTRDRHSLPDGHRRPNDSGNASGRSGNVRFRPGSPRRSPPAAYRPGPFRSGPAGRGGHPDGFPETFTERVVRQSTKVQPRSSARDRRRAPPTAASGAHRVPFPTGRAGHERYW